MSDASQRPGTRGSIDAGTLARVRGGTPLAVEVARLCPESVWPALWRRTADRLERLGRVGGQITLASETERRAVQRFVPTAVSDRVALTALDRAFSERCPEGLWAVVEAALGHPLVSRPETNAATAERWRLTRETWLRVTEHDLALTAWLARATWLKAQWSRDPEGIRAAVTTALEAAAVAPGNAPGRPPTTLPVFAERVTGDPHALDVGTPTGQIFLAAIAARFLPSDAGGVPKTAEARVALLDAAGLALDGISSGVTALGLAGSSATIEAARAEGLVITLPLMTVGRVGALRATTGVAYVVENRGVFTSLVHALDAVPAASRPTLICASGQSTLAVVSVLDGLTASGVRIAYSGDFDPGGLAIAARLAERYGDKWAGWHFALADYVALVASSTPLAGAPLTPWSSEARDRLVEAIAQHGPRYQEALVPVLAHDLLAAARR